MNKPTMAPMDPAIAVLVAMSDRMAASLSSVTESWDPTLKAKKPKNKIKPPRVDS
jgi:hypothetical protein